MGLRSSTAWSRSVAGEWDIIAGDLDTWGGGRPPLIFCHGSGYTALTSWANASQLALVQALAKTFTVAVADLGGDVWGNDTHIARIEAVRAYLAASWRASGPVTLVAGSMGTLGALAYTLAHPGNVRQVAAAIPALDLADLRLRGAAAGIDAAYGGAYNDATQGPTHSPVQFAASLPSSLPIGLWTASDDPIAVPATAAAFTAARPQTARTDLGALGHSDAAIVAATAGIVSFVNAH